MRLYIFKSDTNSGLRAFASDPGGGNLPPQFRPWHVTGVVPADREPPHGMSRKDIEQAIETDGFQLWRMKLKPGKD